MQNKLSDVAVLKKSECGTLDFIDHICKKENIKYFLTYGTLLGAIRHQGFIPWDDDIDIMMPREDYNRFQRLMESETGQYRSLTYQKEPEYPSSYMKLIDMNTRIEEEGLEKIDRYGAFIDIFPLDGSPNSERLRRIYCWIHAKSENLIAYGCPSRACSGLLQKAKACLGRWYRAHAAEKVCALLTTRYNCRNSDYLGVWAFGKPEFPAKIFESSTEAKFENQSYQIPVGYHEFLTIQYGDYMQLPPDEQRVSNHRFKIITE